MNSVIREDLLTRALGRELDGQAYLSRGVLEGSIIPMVEGQGRTAAYRKAIEYILRGNALMNLHPDRRMRQAMIGDGDRKEIHKAGTLLRVLKRTDFCERMAALLKPD